MRNFLNRSLCPTQGPSLREHLTAGKAKIADLAQRLAGARRGALNPQIDPVFAAIAEAERLQAVIDAAVLPIPEDGFDAFNFHVDNVLFETVPTTARGCAALARFTAEYTREHGFSFDEDGYDNQNLRILDLIARSPLL